MKSLPKEKMNTAILMTVIAVVFTILVGTVDRQPVGVEGTKIGLASINTAFFNRLGYNETCYKLSSIFGILSFALGGGFCVFFVIQLVKRKSLSEVDRNLSFLMVLYAVALVLYLIFNKVLVLNYRPILRDKGLESSYPSTHALLAWAILVSAVDQWNIYIEKEKLQLGLVIGSYALLAVVLVTRTLSGVHWLTDIIGGILIADALVAWYRYFGAEKE